MILREKKLLKHFKKKYYKKNKYKKIWTGNVIKRKGDKSYVKWKGYHNLFNSWIDKKDIV